MAIKQTIRCDNCNKIVKSLWSITIVKDDWQVWEMQFCSLECLKSCDFKLKEDEN